jgi:hypothetical protein
MLPELDGANPPSHVVLVLSARYTRFDEAS